MALRPRRWLGVPLSWDVSGQRHATVRYPAGQDTLTPLTLLVEAPRDRPDQAGVSRPLAVAALTLVLRRRVEATRLVSRRRGLLVHHPGAEHFEELGQPGRMRGPGRSGYQVSVGHRLVDRDLGVLRAGRLHLGSHRRIG